MSGLAELVLGQLAGSNVSQLGDAIGSDGDKTQTAIAAALPLLIGALSRNAAKPDGAEALHTALGRDHDGSVLDDITRAFGRESQVDGEKILGHALGSRKQTVEAGVARASGLDSGQATKLMATLAPLVMGALGREVDRLREDGSRYPPALLQLGEIHEQLGNYRNAAMWYERFAELWQDADPEFQPSVEAARTKAEELRARVQ